jgi:hypothetical protein
MVGFIKGLFGSRSQNNDPQKNETQPSQSPQADPAPMEQRQSNAYYLAPDDAKTLGNIDYMRTVKTVRRTFPKTAGATKGYEMVQQVSAMDKLNENGKMAKSIETSTQEVTPQPQANNASAERRATDSSMDMFRKMAKDMKR